ncbi:Transposase IS4 [Popillia japonica]|uniref:Transposase IS4 n=1 Tax=Popillia japonica TaxID=7064 RepID=A0AAW1KM93_POPJA
MSRNRWEQIRSKIHFNDNNLLVGCKDKLYKIRPFIDSIVENFNKIPIREKICVDKEMIPYKGYHSIKQYMKAKLKKWGYKVFVLCGSDDIVDNWELYTGAIDRDPDLPDGGVRGNVVLRLLKIVPPRNLYHKIYFDN